MPYRFIITLALSNPYIRLVHIPGESEPDDTPVKAWDTAANGGQGGLSDTVTWSNSAISLGVKDAVANGWPVKFPSNLPAGEYDIQLYDNTTPVNTDVIKRAWRLVMPAGIVFDPVYFPVDPLGRIKTVNKS